MPLSCANRERQTAQELSLGLFRLLLFPDLAARIAHFFDCSIWYKLDNLMRASHSALTVIIISNRCDSTVIRA